MKRILFVLLCIPVFSFSQTAAIKKIALNKAAFKILHVGIKPDFVATDGDDAWVIDDHQNRILKISFKSDHPLLAVSIPEAGTAPVVAFNSVWVMSCKEKKLYRVDHTTGKIIAKIPTGMADTNGEMSLASGDGSIWLLSDSTGILMRINPANNSIQKKITVKPHSYCAAFGHNAIWITNYAANSVQRIDPKKNAVTATIPVGKKPRFLTVGNEAVWTLNQGDGTVSKIDPSSNKMVATIDVKAVGSGGDISTGSGKVWVVSTNIERPVQMIDALSNKIEAIFLQYATQQPFKVDGGVRVSANYTWISGYHSKTVWVLKN